AKLGAAGKSQVATMRDLRVVVGESDGGVRAGGKHGDPDKAIAKVRPQQSRHDDCDDDEQAAHGWRARFFLMSFWPLFADILPNLEIAQPPDNEWPNDQSSEERCQTRECSAEGDVTKDAEWRNVMLQLQEQQPIEQSASERLSGQ